jgi:small subunit ribosomal protein S24e
MMELKITSDRKNPLLGRREVKFQVFHNGKPTPRKHEVAEKLAAKLDAKIDLMQIENYTTSFGMNSSEGTCLVYENEAAMERAEPTKLINPKKRIGFVEKPAEPQKEEPEKAEAKPEPKKEEPKPDEKKEEAKPETKKEPEKTKQVKEEGKQEPAKDGKPADEKKAKPEKEGKKDEAQAEQKE